jgi:hypothetical protein
MAQAHAEALKHLPDEALTEALARTPADYYVIWNGFNCPSRAGSVRARALRLIEEIWEPVPLRILLTRAARLSGLSGLDPDAVRSAIRMHQSAIPAAYFLARRTLSGDYLRPLSCATLPAIAGRRPHRRSVGRSVSIGPSRRSGGFGRALG